MNKLNRIIVLFGLACGIACASNGDEPVADRTAIERIYYNHRLGDKMPFEQAVPPATVGKMVRLDFAKEAALGKNYRVVITPALLDAEVGRINATTRAPEILAEIKSALGDDPARFANAFAKPFLVDRLLRSRFENDDALHAAQRRQAEQARSELLAAKTNGATWETLLSQLQRGHAGEVAELTWQLGERTPDTNTPTADEIEVKKRFGANAQILSAPSVAGGRVKEFYLDDLPGELQQVLRAQLRQPGDVSAVIEMPGGFQLYLATKKTDAVLGVACLSLPKRNYTEWLEEQTKN